MSPYPISVQLDKKKSPVCTNHTNIQCMVHQNLHANNTVRTIQRVASGELEKSCKKHIRSIAVQNTHSKSLNWYDMVENIQVVADFTVRGLFCIQLKRPKTIGCRGTAMVLSIHDPARQRLVSSVK